MHVTLKAKKGLHVPVENEKRDKYDKTPKDKVHLKQM